MLTQFDQDWRPLEFKVMIFGANDKGVRFVLLTMKPLQHALRRLGQAPLFTSIALVTLALGIGANTAILMAVENLRRIQNAGILPGIRRLA